MSFQSSFARRWQSAPQLPGRIPLRIKLITALLTLVTVALAAISIAGISFLRGYLLGQSDQTLVDWARQSQAQNAVQRCLFSPEKCSAPGQAIAWLPAGGELQQIVVPVNQRFGMPLNPRTMPGPAVGPEMPWLTSHYGKPVTVRAESGGHRWRVISYPDTFIALSGQIHGTVIAGIDVTGVYNTLGRLVSIDLIVSSIVVVALAVVGVAIVRSSLRPLTDIEKTAAAIAAGELSRRVPDRDPRTEVGRLGRALNAMLAQIEAAFHARARSEAAARRSEERMRQFVADASHELRTPLTAIRGYAEYYRQRAGLQNGTRAETARSGGEPATAAGHAATPESPPLAGATAAQPTHAGQAAHAGPAQLG
ncbi:MAG TPA: HAMP domain-containing protein, partial [Streptosporangiaceae bacterium]